MSTHVYRELAVYHWGSQGDTEVDIYHRVTKGTDTSGWLVVNLPDDKGTVRYPPSSVIKIRESA